MSACAVVDVGTARTKVLIGRRDAQGLSIQATKIESRLGEFIADSQLDREALRQRLADLDSRLEAALREAGVGRYVVVGGEFFRQLAQASGELAQIMPLCGPPVPLTTVAETLLFRRALTALGALHADDVVCDIGGGSVQVSWGEGEEMWCSLPCGTFSLEKRFQRGSPATAAELDAMAADVRQALQRAAPSLSIHRSRVVFGSTCMQDFVASVTAALVARGTPVETAAEGSLRLGDVERLLALLQEMPYDKAGELFPANPGFMAGADKLVVVLREVMNFFSATSALPTNESIGTGLMRLLFDDSPTFTAFGIDVRGSLT